MPWRNSKDPYQIWLSEILLQQTRVDQGTSYFHKFIETFPTVQDLAQASEEEILKLWQGLGYYSRARNLHACAKIIHANGNIFPNNRIGLLALKGVGPYTSAAIASIAFNEPVAAVDGNVNRVISRYFGVTDAIDSREGKAKIEVLANEVLDQSHPGDHNQAMMDFGATLCTPSSPNCSSCPLVQGCYAFANEKTQSLPYKAGKTKVTPVHFDYFVFIADSKVAANRRTGNAIWKNMYAFPCVETTNGSNPKPVDALEFLHSTSNGQATLKHICQLKHLLSHRSITADFWEVTVAGKLEFRDDNTQLYTEDQFEKLPVPRLIEKFWHIYKQGQ